MTLFLTHAVRVLSAPTHNCSLPRLERIPNLSSQFPSNWRRVDSFKVFRCCAVPLGADSGDGAGKSFAPSVGSSPVLQSSGAAGAVKSSEPDLKGEEAEQTATEAPWIAHTENRIERAIFDFRFLTLMAIGGSLVGSLLCFLKGCGFVYDSYVAYLAIYLSGVHTGKVILRLVEAVEIYLVGTVMLIFAMGLFGLFISNESQNGLTDRALKNTNLFGMFTLTKRPLWMQITSLDALKTKLGHCIVMILIVKLFEKSKTVCIASSMDLLLYSVAIFLTAASLYVLQKLHESQFSGTQAIQP